MYYDLQGHPISFEEYIELSSLGKKRIAKTDLPNRYWVSTVWLGMDHSFGEGPPLIFESMVFKGEDFTDQDCERYSTEEEALAGHQVMVEKWMKLATA